MRYKLKSIILSLSILILSTSLVNAELEIDLRGPDDLKRLRDIVLLAAEDYTDNLTINLKNTNYKMDEVVQYMSRYVFVSDKEIKGLKFIVKEGGSTDIKIIFEMSEVESWIVDKYIENVIEKYIIPSQTDEEKIHILHEYVKAILSYDNTLKCSSSYCAILSNKAICRGYNKLFYKLLKEAGVESNIVIGYTKDSNNKEIAHEWLELNLNGELLYIDITWNDTSNSNKYYLKNREFMNKDHKVEYIIRR